MSYLARTLSLAAASLLLAAHAHAAGPLQAELLQVEVPLLAATSGKAPALPSKASPAATAPAAALAGSAQPARTRAEVLAELRSARAAGALNHAEAEIGWPVQARIAR